MNNDFEWPRREVITAAAAAGAVALMPSASLAAKPKAGKPGAKKARAITMWEFSWIERRWPGAGYEDWDQALDELAERGYDAVRIDPFPHLLAVDGTREWTVVPCWNTQEWGSPALNTVRILPALYEFMGKCRDRGIKVALSSWFRETTDDVRMRIKSPADLARAWQTTLDGIKKAGLLDTVLWVDVVNEWPGPRWCPFFQPALDWGQWDDPRGLAYIKTAIEGLRLGYPNIPILFSTMGTRSKQFGEVDLGFVDAIEHHIWMAALNNGEFYNILKYEYELFTPVGYEKLQAGAEKLYRSKPEYWQGILTREIDLMADISRKINQPLATTECWGLVDYKDYPLLPWNWIKDLCALGTTRAAATGQWVAIATSNFCGPQFVGMWQDFAWHRRMTDAIKNAPLNPALKSSRLWARL
jgi:Sugar-binding cellulase-like